MKLSGVMRKAGALCLLLATLLTGCAKEPPRPEVHLENGKHIRQQLDEGLWIDLTVDYPKETIPRIYRSELPPMNEAVVECFLDVIGDRPREVLYDDTLEGCRYYAVRTENGASISFSRTVEDVNLPICMFSYDTTMSGFYGFALRDNWPQREASTSDNTDLYRVEKEFPFGSCLDAQQQAEAILKSIGIPDAVLTETLYMDHKTMTEYLRTPEAAEALSRAGAQELALTGCDELYDAYYFRFTLAREGVLATGHILEAATSYVAPTEMTVLINSSGPVSVYVNAPWRFLDAEEAASAMTLPDAVLQKVIEQEIDTLTPFPRTIDGLRLAYLAIQAGDRWIRTPVWIATVLYEGTIQVSDEHRVYLFDAISGDRIS